MKKYLLSSGRETTDVIDYAIDYIKVYLILKFNDIPYSSFGNTADMTVNIKSEVLYQIKRSISEALIKVSSEIPSLTTSLNSVDFDNSNNILASININNESVNLSLSL